MMTLYIFNGIVLNQFFQPLNISLYLYLLEFSSEELFGDCFFSKIRNTLRNFITMFKKLCAVGKIEKLKRKGEKKQIRSKQPMKLFNREKKCWVHSVCRLDGKRWNVEHKHEHEHNQTEKLHIMKWCWLFECCYIHLLLCQFHLFIIFVRFCHWT